MRSICCFLVLFHCLNVTLFAQGFYGKDPFAHTYSIVAIDPETGDMGVAVQSHWFSVGSVVAWGEAGIGVVATQSFVNVSFGVRGLELLKNGLSPQEAVDSLLSDDPGREYRQLAILDKTGKVAVHTGASCVKPAGHIKGENYSVQANMMSNNQIWPAMAKAFENSKGPLAERMMTALEAAEAAGGDIRGKQSAALYVFRAKSTGKEWEEKLVDLRIEDHPEPIKELRRLLKVHRAYEHMNAGDLAIEHKDMKKAMEEYSAAQKLFPDNEEMKFWQAVTLANNGDIEKALEIFAVVFKKNNNWRLMIPSLQESGLMTVNQTELDRIKKVR